MNNLAGQKFNKLLALKPTDQRKGGCVVWECQCDCGNICYVSSRSLKSGNTKSCGCLNKEKKIERIKKYNEEHSFFQPGMVIEELTLLEPTTFRDGTNIVWKCRCSCGKICYVNTNNLKIQKSCGHNKGIQYKDISNQRFGKLIAIKPTSERKHGCVVWECQCDCGNICYKTSSTLIGGGAQSCGCLKSKGEELISKILRKANIPFEQQYNFDRKIPYFFDFYINNKYLIEYDGIQHFEQTGWDKLEDIQQRDLIKNNWCKENNIPLIRIPYTHLNNLVLEDLLLETSSFIVV